VLANHARILSFGADFRRRRLPPPACSRGRAMRRFRTVHARPPGKRHGVGRGGEVAVLEELAVAEARPAASTRPPRTRPPSASIA
jgi:hypothetical protein